MYESYDEHANKWADKLTELYNNGEFDEHNTYEIKALSRSKSGFSALYSFMNDEGVGQILCTEETAESFYAIELAEVNDKSPFYELYRKDAMSWGFDERVKMNGAVEYLPKSNEYTHGNSKALVMKTSLGDLIVYPGGDPGIYDEFSIDLIAPDGRYLQVACVGVAEDRNGSPELHVYAWDGLEEFSVSETILDVGDDSYWYEK